MASIFSIAFDYFSILFIIISLSITAVCGMVWADKDRYNIRRFLMGYAWLLFWICGGIFVMANIGLLHFFVNIGK